MAAKAKLKAFSKCVKKSDKSKGEAYKSCSKLFKKLTGVTKGEVLKESKPKHNMYALSEGAEKLIDKLLKDLV